MNTVFFLLLLIFPLAEITRITFSNSLGITLNDIAVGIVALFWFLQLLANNNYKKVISNSLILPIGIFIGVCFLSLLVNFQNYQLTQILTGSLYIVRWVAYASLFFIIYNFDGKTKKKITNYLIGSGFIVLLLGFIQYLLYPNLRNLYYAGWDEHLYRMFSSFLDPNFAGAFFVMYFLFLGIVLFDGREKKGHFSWLLFTCGLLSFIAIFLTYSRSAFIFLVVSGCIVFFLIGKKTFIGAFLIVAIFFALLSTFLFHSEGTNLLRTTSSFTRIASVDQAITIWKDHPLFGVGFDTYRYARQQYGFEKVNEQIPDHAGAGVDTSIVFVLVTTGVVGVAAYCYLLFSICKKLLLQTNDPPLRIPSIFVFALLIGFFISSLFINSLFYPFLMEWMWIVLGLTIKIEA